MILKNEIIRFIKITAIIFLLINKPIKAAICEFSLLLKVFSRQEQVVVIVSCQEL